MKRSRENNDAATTIDKRRERNISFVPAPIFVDSAEVCPYCGLRRHKSGSCPAVRRNLYGYLCCFDCGKPFPREGSTPHGLWCSVGCLSYILCSICQLGHCSESAECTRICPACEKPVPLGEEGHAYLLEGDIVCYTCCSSS